MHSRPGANQRKNRESSALAAAVHPTTKRDSVLPYWCKNRSANAREPTTAKELVMRDPEFIGWVDASGEGVVGGWLPGKDALEPSI